MTKTVTETVKPETPRQARFVLGASKGMHLLLPDNVSAPKEVLAANAASVTAHDTRHRAFAELRSAETEVKRARMLDERADAAALAANKPLPESGQRVEDKAREALVVARRRADAADSRFTDCQFELCRAIARNAHEWEHDQHEAISAMQSEGNELVQRLRHLLRDLAAERRVQDALERFNPGGGSVVGVDFGRIEQTHEVARQGRLEAEAAASVANTRGNLSSMVSKEPTQLLAAIELLIRKGRQ